MKKSILLFIVLVLVFQVGCKSGVDKDIVEVEDPGIISVEVTAEDKVIIDRSENLSDFIVELFGIDDAATIIFNDTALVGVIMAYDKELTDDTKKLINDIVMEKDTAIKQVLISNDDKTFNQIVNIMNELMNGSPYDKYVSEINKMIEKTNKRH